jgi:SAM-dependent methyltransferase
MGFHTRWQKYNQKRETEKYLTLEKQSSGRDNFWWRLVRYGFGLLYNEMAWTYDAVSWVVSLGQWRDWQRAGLAHLAGHRVLELAHGPGHMLPELEAAGYAVVGLDLSEAMGRIARARLRRDGKNVPLVRASAHSLPFAAETFDSVLATFPTEFIVDRRALASLFRALRPDGRLVIVPEARLTSGGTLRGIIEWLYAITGQRGFPDGEESGSDPWHLARERFIATGFTLQVEEVELDGSVVTVVVAHKPPGTADNLPGS